MPGSGKYTVQIAAKYGIEVLALNMPSAENFPIAEKEMQKFYLAEQDKIRHRVLLHQHE